jgi:flagellar basal-body rod modification protein FlgD
MAVIQNTSAATVSMVDPVLTSAQKKAEDPTDRFLKLLVTQMKNQDPLNPMDNAQVTSQMAQISTVSGIDKLNTTLQNMAASFSANQSLQATSMIGHGVLVPGTSMQLSNGMAMGGIDLPQSVDQMTVSIQDAAGNVIHRMELGPKESGINAFAWDGVTDTGKAAADGVYNFSVSAMQAGKKIDGSSLSVGQVNSVTPAAGGMLLDVGGLGTVGLDKIKKIL